ncbi:C6 zinc finger domain protein [Rhexocercosporidium sp. MPI-PUGE-AT-0058]|nr:C6 zinc finger domain protein [Rhexocercosporidium sp. MPI-PUGE-AT-0058]
MDTEGGAEPNAKKRRILKACTACRTSKLRCDGGKPCTRCRKANAWCDYVKTADDALAEKLARLEEELAALRNPGPDTSTAVTLLQLQQQQSIQNGISMSPPSPHNQAQPYFGNDTSPASMGSSSHMPVLHGPRYVQNPLQGQTAGSGFAGGLSNLNLKRKRRDFELSVEPTADVVTKGLISMADAFMYFQTFFQGCDKYVPVFDPAYDTFESVRQRSAMLFDVICAVGCRAEHGPGSDQYQILSNATKSPICEVMLGTVSKSIETIQALLVNACYSEKGWLLTSMATRIALDLDLPTAFNRLSTLILQAGTSNREEESILMREARVWFGTFVLEHILSLDCGKRPGIKAVDGMRRCRVLLGHPSRNVLDFRLLAQVELNAIRALAQERLSPKPGQGNSLSDEEMSEIVQETRVDLSVWLSDWTNLVESNINKEEDKATLEINLKIQRDWSEMTMLCQGLQGMGIENVAIMSDSQQNLIHQAKISAQRHLSIILSNPELYIVTFQFGMDFVWAKCAFSVLLLLKLARLLPSSTDMSALISDAKTLLSHLSKVRGSSNIYFRILRLSVEKCEKALNGDVAPSGVGQSNEVVDAEMDFQNYVPKEFILEWNFPGLTFCWIPFDFQDLFMDFGNGFGGLPQ